MNGPMYFNRESSGLFTASPAGVLRAIIFEDDILVASVVDLQTTDMINRPFTPTPLASLVRVRFQISSRDASKAAATSLVTLFAPA
ncbi:hypothetical protein MRX96_028937 [Rhipicephalus microplus]